MIKLIVLSVLLDAGDSNIYVTVATEPIKAIEGSFFNEYDYIYRLEARRRGGKGNKKRRRGGNGLR